MKRKSKRGGPRIGSGRKQKYGEPTTIVSYCIPVSKVAIIDKRFKSILDEYSKKSA